MKRICARSLAAAFIAASLLSACASPSSPTPAVATQPPSLSSPTLAVATQPPAPTVPPPTQTPAPTPLPYASLQQGNDLPLVAFSTRRSGDLPQSGIGTNYEDYQRYGSPELFFDTGFKLVRIMCLTNFFNADQTGPEKFALQTIPPEADRVIDEYLANGVKVVLVLWLGADLVPYGTTFRTQDELDQFNDHVRFVVDHFKGRIPYYEIWNEPGDMTPDEYAGLVRSTVPVIRETDPQAKIIIGGTPGDWKPDFPGYGDHQRFTMTVDMLNGLLRSGVAPLVDGISWHPFYDNIPEDPYYQDYPAMLQGIKDLAAAQGFTGEYFADELLWRTVSEADWAGGPPVSAVVAAKHYARAITLHRGYGVNVTINTFFIEPDREWIPDDAMWPIRNVANILAGAQPAELAVMLSGEGENVSQYGFKLENGDGLVAIWINNAAIEDDPGLPVTLTVPGAAAQHASAIDVMHGFEQQLVASAVGADLLIEGFRLKDYPIFIRLTP